MMDVLFTLAGALAAIFIYRIGYRDGGGRKLQPLVSMPHIRKAVDKETKKINTLMANVEVYDGTGRGQMKID